MIRHSAAARVAGSLAHAPLRESYFPNSRTEATHDLTKHTRTKFSPGLGMSIEGKRVESGSTPEKSVAGEPAPRSDPYFRTGDFSSDGSFSRMPAPHIFGVAADESWL